MNNVEKQFLLSWGPTGHWAKRPSAGFLIEEDENPTWRMPQLSELTELRLAVSEWKRRTEHQDMSRIEVSADSEFGPLTTDPEPLHLLLSPFAPVIIGDDDEIISVHPSPDIPLLLNEQAR